MFPATAYAWISSINRSHERYDKALPRYPVKSDKYEFSVFIVKVELK